MIKGVGCDIVQIKRFKQRIDDLKFLNKVFTTEEQAYIVSHSVSSASGIWASKEAFVKALGTGFVGIKYTDIEVFHEDSGVPKLKFSENLQKLVKSKNIENVMLSISHEKDYAIAFVVLE